MKILLIHGDDEKTSRERLNLIVKTIRKRGWEVNHLSSSNLSIRENLSGTSLFSDEALFVIEEITKIDTHDFKWIKDNYQNSKSNLLFWHKKALPQTFFKNLPKETKIEKFDLPRELYGFLNTLTPGNRRKALQSFRDLVAKNPPELVFTLLARHFRDMYFAKVAFEDLNYPSWRKQRLKDQASKFSGQSLEGFIGLLAQIDIKNKTSNTSLVSLLDLALVTNLE